jgi:F-type H+-transporting ATPase subunit b
MMVKWSPRFSPFIFGSRLTPYAQRAAGMLFILSLAVVSAHAEEGGAQEPANDLFKWINFAVLAALIIWLALKNGPAFFKRRADVISSAIEKSTQAKNLAEQQLREAETRLHNLEQEIADLRTTAQRESVAEGERIRTLTRADAQKIDAAANAEVDATERAARLELKALAANLAVDGAESMLANQLTPSAQESLIKNFVKSLAGRPN